MKVTMTREWIRWVFCWFLLVGGLSASEVVKWEKALPPIPNFYGVAGSYAGIVGEGDERVLLVAGGANFPYANPFDETLNANGGQPKVWHDTVYALPLGAEKKAWQTLDVCLPQVLAYGSSVTLPKRASVLMIGGSSRVAGGEEEYSKAVYEWVKEGAEWKFEKVAELPIGVAYGAAVESEGKVYLLGGKSAEGELARAWVLDTNVDRVAWQWQEMPWPEVREGVQAAPRAFHVVGVQGRKIYLIGGRCARGEAGQAFPEGVNNPYYKTQDFKDAYVYSPGKVKAHEGRWTRVADLPKAISAAPQHAVASGASHLIVIGGVTLEMLEDIQNEEKYPELNVARQGVTHPGFPRDLWAYHSITNTWSVIGSVPSAYRVPVTTPVVVDGRKFILPSGEWSPKLRTPAVLSGEMVDRVVHFGMVNWVVVGAYLLGMVGVGYWFMKRESASSTEAYFRGGQRVPWWVAGLSIFATMLSALTFMGIPARAYEHDIAWYIGQLPILIVAPLVALFYLPYFRKLDITSAYEYLEMRFGLGVRLFASLSFIVFHVGRIAIVLYLPALAIAAVTGIDVTTAILIMSVLCIIYTVMGGIEAVVWTDAIQALVLMGGALLCFVLVVMNVDGGFGEVVRMASADEKLFSSLSWGSVDIGNGTSAAWVILVAFFFNSLVPYTSGQDVVQRYVTTSDEGAARKSLWTTMWMSVFGSFVFFSLGVAIYVFYKTQPELLNPAMAKTDGILPFYIVQQLPVGVSGLIIAAIFAASQSTVSSSLNSSATAYIKDIDARLLRRNREDQVYLRAAQLAVVVIGVLGTIVAVIMAKSDMEGAFKAFNSIIGLTAGSLGGLFALGVFTRLANGVAALIAALAGSGTVIALYLTKAPVTGLLYAAIGFMVCVVVGAVLGMAMRPDEAKLESIKQKKS